MTTCIRFGAYSLLKHWISNLVESRQQPSSLRLSSHLVGNLAARIISTTWQQCGKKSICLSRKSNQARSSTCLRNSCYSFRTQSCSSLPKDHGLHGKSPRSDSGEVRPLLFKTLPAWRSLSQQGFKSEFKARRKVHLPVPQNPGRALSLLTHTTLSMTSLKLVV